MLERLYYSKLAILIMFAAIILVGSKLLGITEQKVKINDEVAQTTEQVQKLEEENMRLKASLELLNNPEYLKKEAKRRFNLLEPNEKVIIIPSK